MESELPRVDCAPLVNNNKEGETNFDSFLDRFGQFGRYQQLLALFLWLLVSPFLAFVIYGNMLLLLTPDHWCDLSDLPGNASLEEKKSLAIPLEEVEGQLRYSRCYRYRFNDSPSFENVTRLPVKCQNWDYNYTLVYSTLVSELNWVCDDAWRTYFAYTVFWGGTAVGVLIMGTIADMFGRVPVLVVGHAVCAVASCATNFVTDFTWFMIVRFIIGCMVISQSMTAYVLVMEYVGSKHRLLVSSGYLFAYPLLGCILPWIAYFLRDWKTINLVVSVPLFVVPVLFKFIPESLRWLVAKQRFDRVRKILKTMSRINNKDFPPEFFDTMEFPLVKTEGKKHTLFDMLKKPNMRRIFLFTNVSWMCTSLCFTGGYVYAATVSDNPFLMITANSALDIVANAIADRLADKYGRRPTAVSSLLVAALSYMSIAAVPKDTFAVRTTSLVIGRLALTAGYNVNYLYAAEVYPTVVRTQALAIRQALGSAGNFLSPVVVMLAMYARYLPLLVFGAISALAAAVMIFLPETLNRSLPESLEDGEELATLPGLCQCCEKREQKDFTCDKPRVFPARM
ncbi:solute carrier family 22 member 5-like isoform X1 [Centruroides sculpturatus]|uniref:solute carrier family 22 member 5-like isoform X1 n=1 Tax=Centruroides sculpturatus TaxID=218467 RepID=UPI000C6EB6E4|nr:solute carrier family 22 member 5-like isoform X1 [Centruroides sculpturatus]